MGEPILPLAIVRNDDGDTFVRMADNEFGWNWRRFGFVAHFNWDHITRFGECEPTVIFAGVDE